MCITEIGTMSVTFHRPIHQGLIKAEACELAYFLSYICVTETYNVHCSSYITEFCQSKPYKS